jgi:hypothetical protein
MAKEADLAFAGTVDSLTYRHDADFAITDIHFSKVQLARSDSSSGKLTLSVLGGSDGGSQLIVNGMPRFEVGKRYIVLAVDHGTRANWYIPILGMSDGFFSVSLDSVRGLAVVHDCVGRPLVRLERGHIVVLATNVHWQGRPGEAPHIETVPGFAVEGSTDRVGMEIVPLELDPGTRVSETEFLTAVRRLAGGP